MLLFIENGILKSDLDLNGFSLINLGNIDPPPPNLVDTADPRLSDARAPIDGSVTNASIAAGAAITQNKLNLNGAIPPAWLGTTSTTAARGDLAEYLSNKGQPGGYASLDGSAKLPVAQVPAGVGSGTVTSVQLTMPSQFAVSGGPITNAGTLSVAWNNVPDGSWFGNPSGVSGPPTFQTTPLPLSLIPDLDTAKITTGTIAAARLPAAVGVGASHAPGAVPDPGAAGAATEYLARDMTYKALPALGPTYQPTVANPAFSVSAGPSDNTVYVTCATPGANIFYSTTSATAGFLPLPSTGFAVVAFGATVWAYAARAGYNNSSVVNVVT